MPKAHIRKGKLRIPLSDEIRAKLDLQDGDLKMTTDFRSVYASVLDGWLGLPSKVALGGNFTGLRLFRS